ncbi:DUF1189 family protein [uncultured Clostridium sp.]|uniref:DUF1189 family protein n=1 Tax=uncultured Clostridium sp. TaxID=59620 RepID=UPI0025ED3FAD|nr:DUF1189 family protein [uncultured Clostridium sp.]
MKFKINFFKKFIASIYDMDSFSKYAKEGLLKAIIYIMIVCAFIGIIKGGFLGYKINSEINSIINYIEHNEINISIRDGMLDLESDITKSSFDNIYFDNIKIYEYTDFSNVFYNNKADILILKDGIVFNNYGDIEILNYRNIFPGEYVDSQTIINTVKSFLMLITLAIIPVSILNIVKGLIINYLIVVTAALLVSLLMKMVVKYKALWSIVIYASTLPLIILTVLNIIQPNINFDMVFVGGTLTYVILILRYIKKEIIQNLIKARKDNNNKREV